MSDDDGDDFDGDPCDNDDDSGEEVDAFDGGGESFGSE